MQDLDDTQLCRRCDTEKPISDFSSDRRTASGLKAWCKSCCNEYARDQRRGTSSESLIQAAVQLVHPTLPEDRTKIDFFQIQVLSGAPMNAIRLYVMRAYQAIEDQKLAELRVQK